MSIARAEVALVGKDQTAQAFRNVVRNAETASRSIQTKFRAAFSFLGVGTAIYGLTRAVSGAIKAGDDLAKFAEKSGLAAEAASELTHAAKMQDIELGSLATGLKKMQVTLSEAGSGTKSATATLTALGLTFEQLQALEPDQQFELIAEQISKLKDPADRTRAAVELFGRAGADLLPLFTEGAAGIRRAREEAQLLGKSFSAADLKQFQEMDDAIKRLKTSASSLADVLTLTAAPAITGFFNVLRMSVGRGNAAEQIAMQIAALEKVRLPHPGKSKELEQLYARLDLLLNPRNSGMGGRGRVAKDDNPVVGFLADIEKQAKLTNKELEQLERFMRFQEQDAQKISATDYSGKFQRSFSIAPLREVVAESDAAAANQRFGAAMESDVQAINAAMDALRVKTIEVDGEFFEVNEQAKGLMETLKDEGARRALGTLSDLIYSMGDGADDFGRRMLDAIRRILADQAAQQLFALFAGMGKGSGSGFLSSLASGISSLFGGGSKGGGSGVPRMARGGFIPPGGMAIVGEGGEPELAFGGRAGATIIPMSKGAAQRSVHIQAPLSISVRVDGSTDRSITQQQIDRTVRGAIGEYNEFWRDQLSRGAYA